MSAARRRGMTLTVAGLLAAGVAAGVVLVGCRASSPPDPQVIPVTAPSPTPAAPQLVTTCAVTSQDGAGNGWLKITLVNSGYDPVYVSDVNYGLFDANNDLITTGETDDFPGYTAGAYVRELDVKPGWTVTYPAQFTDDSGVSSCAVSTWNGSVTP